MFERRQFGTSPRRALFFIGGYKTSISTYRPFYWLARLLGYRVYAYVLDAERVVSAHITGYADQVKAVTQDIEVTISSLPSDMELFVMGNSLGSESALYALKHIARLRAAILVTARGSIAEFIWNTQEGSAFKPVYEKNGYDFEQLAEELRPIEPLQELDQTTGRPIYLIYAADDTVIPPANTKLLIGKVPNLRTKLYRRGNHGGATVMGLAALWRWHYFFKWAGLGLK